MTTHVSKTCKVWIPLKSSMFYSGCLGYREMSLPLFLLFCILTKFSSMIPLLCPPNYWLPSPFYSVIPRVWGPVDSPPLLPWVPEPIMCLSPRRLILSLFLIISSFWCCFFESPWLTFHSKVCLGSSSWFLVFSKLFTLSDSTFGRSLSLSLFPSGRNPFLLGRRFSLLPPFIAPHSGFPGVPSLWSWMTILNFQLSCYIIGRLRRTCLPFIFCAFLVLPLSYLNLVSCIPRITNLLTASEIPP